MMPSQDPSANTLPLDQYQHIHTGVVAVLEAARSIAARNVNALMTASYWEIGRRIVEFEQAGQERAAYGAELLKRLALDLTQRFGRGFSIRNLEQMSNFYLLMEILQTVSAKLLDGNFKGQRHEQEGVRLPVVEPSRLPPTDLSALARNFPLPWSAYVRLLSVKNHQACGFARFR